MFVYNDINKTKPHQVTAVFKNNNYNNAVTSKATVIYRLI